jgi:hypothetical protein
MPLNPMGGIIGCYVGLGAGQTHVADSMTDVQIDHDHTE